MTDFQDRIRADWPRMLEGVLAQCAKHKRAGLLAFDLDSTLFDNRPRQAKIVREFGAARALLPLTACQPFHFTNGWDLKAACVAAGLSVAETDSQYNALKAFWAERFFSSEYCEDDIEIVGAPRFVHACIQAGATVAYCTGRHEGMREGTVRALKKCGFPLPNEGTAVSLLMKPTQPESDDAYKREAHAQLASMGQLIAAFDNEPTHINDYAAAFPNSVPVHLATDHSGRTMQLHERTISIPHFAW